MDFIEKDCTIEYCGRKFTSGGAIVTSSYLVCYPSNNGKLTDWHGNIIGTYSIISSRPAIFFGRHSFLGSTYYFMRGIVNGVTYSLRGFGKGMIARGKAVNKR